MAITITITAKLVSIECPNCSGIYAISENYQDEARKLGGFKQCWTCPYCKEERGYGESEADKLRKLITQMEQSNVRLEEAKRYAEQEADHFRKSRDAIKGVLTKERKRVGNGVCPCCNRSFINLKRHMKTKHPNHATAHGESNASSTEASSSPPAHDTQRDIAGRSTPLGSI